MEPYEVVEYYNRQWERFPKDEPWSEEQNGSRIHIIALDIGPYRAIYLIETKPDGNRVETLTLIDISRPIVNDRLILDRTLDLEDAHSIGLKTVTDYLSLYYYPGDDWKRPPLSIDEYLRQVASDIKTALTIRKEEFLEKARAVEVGASDDYDMFGELKRSLRPL